METIQRIYYTPKQAASELHISVAELRRRVKVLHIPIRHKGRIHCSQIKKLAAYRETIEAENVRLKKELAKLYAEAKGRRY